MGSRKWVLFDAGGSAGGRRWDGSLVINEHAFASESSLGDLQTFWNTARLHVASLPEQLPEAWAFGATTEQADELLSLVLAGTKTGTASALWDIEDDGDSLPEAGELSIILDGQDRPRAIIETTAVNIVDFDQVTAEHAHAEGEGDLTLEAWRTIHECFWRKHSRRGFADNMPVVCERFRLVFATDDGLRRDA
jgi:uncharacterized protein YhfF